MPSLRTASARRNSFAPARSGLSIGFDPLRPETVPHGRLAHVLPDFGVSREEIVELASQGEDVRVIREVRLHEVSVVTFPAQWVARVTRDPSAAEEREMEAVVEMIQRLQLMEAESQLREIA